MSGAGVWRWAAGLAMMVCGSAVWAGTPPAPPSGALQIYFVDVEGGQATLFVTPERHSLLVDTGWPDQGGRDAGRIAAAMKLAGIAKLDAVLLTHYHDDHTGGVPQLLERVPVGMFLDHGPSREPDNAPTAAAYAGYQKALASGKYQHHTLHVGQRLPVPGFDATVVSADGQVLREPLAGGGEANAFCADAGQKTPDATENGRSLGFAMQWGPHARILDLGDLTRDKEKELMCPRNMLGHVDLLVVSHHGWYQSSSPALVDAIAPRVAVMDNGAVKGGSVPVLDTLRALPGQDARHPALWQLHYSDEGGARHNTASGQIANLQGTAQGPDPGYLLRAIVAPDGAIAVWNSRTGESYTYRAAERKESFVEESSGAPASAQNSPPSDAFHNPSLPVEQRVDDLVRRMTLDEKVGQMMNAAPAIPRLGIPAYDWWSEGLHGIARSGYATVFPQAIGMAATWDKALIRQEAEVVATEARAKYNQASAEGNHARYFGLTIWSPNINIFRDPRWGRGQETYGEDPLLTAELGSAFVRGLQGTEPTYKTIATPKHFAVHSGPESTRHKANVDPSPYDLESTYLPAFRATIVDAKADSLMCAYNAVDGSPACASDMLLKQTLHGAWGFKGFVTSDCGAVDDFFHGHDTSPDAEHAAATAVLAGTDTNCGDTYKALGKAVHDGLLPESAIDTAVKRLFTARVQLGMFDSAEAVPFNRISMSENDSPEHRALAEQAAREAMVLLKNDGTLPLKQGVKTIAVVGPNAASLLALEGNYNAIPSKPALPVDGLRAQFGDARVVYAQGSPYVGGVELPAPRTLFHTEAGREGLTGTYYPSADASGAPVATRVDPQVDFDWTYASPVPGLQQASYSVRWTGTLTPPKPGSYRFGLKIHRCNDGCDNKGTEGERNTERVAMTLDGKPVDLSRHTPGTDDWGTLMPEADLQFADTKPHRITIEYRHGGAKTEGGLSLRWMAPVATELDEAVAAARQADVVVAFVGLTSELEGEEMPVHVEGFAGGDRTLIDLPAPQRKLLEAVGATGKPLVVVLENGSALAVNWAATHANAVLEAWYPGEAGGTAIAETLAGKSNPGGKLPVTFYTGVDELPAFDDYAMRNRTYRYFTGKPLYGFGYGLSYTKFAFSGLKLSGETVAAGQTLTVESEVRNTGEVAGDEVAELYLVPPRTELSPRRQLVAFQRVHLVPGERRAVRFQLEPRQLSVVDAQGDRAMRAGNYGLFLGGGQPEDVRGVTGRFSVTGEQALPK